MSKEKKEKKEKKVEATAEKKAAVDNKAEKKDDTLEEILAASPATEKATEKTDEPAVESELDQTKEKLDAMEDKFLRAQAEIANMTRRNKTEREQFAKFRSQDLAKGILSSLDNLERALAIEVDGDHAASLKKGVAMVLESLQAALKAEGVTEIPALNEPFNPTLHQAVQTMPAEEGVASDTVVQVLQKGYQLHERVLRPAMVIVAQ